ncbi:MAG: helix-turn-helix transcriptional regulator [Bdellovibrionales bacterium]
MTVAAKDSKIQWSQDQIRVLRLRLGWTQADLARRLECGTQLVESLEAGETLAAVDIVHKLELISHQADLCGDEIQSLPAAENFCDQEQLGQVELNKVRRNL